MILRRLSLLTVSIEYAAKADQVFHMLMGQKVLSREAKSHKIIGLSAVVCRDFALPKAGLLVPGIRKWWSQRHVLHPPVCLLLETRQADSYTECFLS